MVFFGAFMIVRTLYSQQQAELEKQALIDIFYNQALTDLDDEVEDDAPPPQDVNRYENTIAILRIASIDLIAPVGFGVKEKDLKKQVGMYTTTDKFITVGGNTGLAAHTAYRNVCSYCFFYRLREVKLNDAIEIDYKDGKTYRFRVIDILNDRPITADIPYKYKKEGSALITLSTCSNYGDTRDFVVAEWIETISP